MAESDRWASIRHVISAQIFSRVVTFAMNIGIARVAAVADYGVGTVAFQLFTTLALFGAKEGCRKVALRSANGKEEAKADARQSAINIAWLGVVTTLLSCAPLVFLWLRDYPAYRVEIFLLAIGALFEAMAEPFVVEALLRSDFRSRAVGEGAAILMRTLFIFAWAALGIGPLPRAFAYGSLVYGLAWLGWFALRRGAWSAVVPKALAGGLCLPFHWELLKVFSCQVLMKVLLAEGEKLVLLKAFDDAAMGVFGLVSNLGSLVVRLIFAPVEEIAYAAFGKEGGKARQHLPLFRTLLCLQGLLGWTGLCFGPAFSQVAVRILYTKTWLDAGAGTVLALYCVLLFFMALNGVCEAFVHAVASPTWMRRMQLLSIGIFFALVGIALMGRSYGPIALVLANSVAMTLRVGLCVLYLRSSEVGATWQDVCPPTRIFCLLAAAGAICWLAVPSLTDTDSLPWLSIAASVALAVVLLAAIGYVSRRELKELVDTARSKKD